MISVSTGFTPKRMTNDAVILMPAIKELLRAVVGELGDFEQVVGDAAHDLPDFCGAVIGKPSDCRWANRS
jgi:hypothetical protein